MRTPIHPGEILKDEEWDAETIEHVEAQLASGVPISYQDDAFPGEIVREYPDGRREISDFDDDGREIVVRPIEPRVTH